MASALVTRTESREVRHVEDKPLPSNVYGVEETDEDDPPARSELARQIGLAA
jgi:hypothetical protein